MKGRRPLDVRASGNDALFEHSEVNIVESSGVNSVSGSWLRTRLLKYSTLGKAECARKIGWADSHIIFSKANSMAGA
jgi:hypothetical protein